MATIPEVKFNNQNGFNFVGRKMLGPETIQTVPWSIQAHGFSPYKSKIETALLDPVKLNGSY